jgi:hypothetical protein
MESSSSRCHEAFHAFECLSAASRHCPTLVRPTDLTEQRFQSQVWRGFSPFSERRTVAAVESVNMALCFAATVSVAANSWAAPCAQPALALAVGGSRGGGACCPICTTETCSCLCQVLQDLGMILQTARAGTVTQLRESMHTHQTPVDRLRWRSGAACYQWHRACNGQHETRRAGTDGQRRAVPR